MTIKNIEWVQREWITPGVSLYRDKGDYNTLNALLPGPRGRTLRRAPSWTNAVSLNGKPLNAFYDTANNRRVFIYTDNTDLLTEYATTGTPWTISSGGTIKTTMTALGGLEGRNILYWGAKLYLIDSAGNVQAGTSYTTALTEIYSGTNGYALCSFGDHAYLATTTGDVIRLHQTTYEHIFTTSAAINILYMTAYSGALLIIARAADGTLALHTLNPSSPTLHTIAHVPNPPNQLPTNGRLFCKHAGAIYFSPGRHLRTNGLYDLDIWKWDGGQPDWHCRIENTATTLNSTGLVSWREHLIYYALLQGAGVTQSLKAILNGWPTDMLDLNTNAVSTFVPQVHSLGGELILTEATAAPAYSFRHAGDGGLQDGYYLTAYLDMGHPNREKRLEHVTVFMNNAIASFGLDVSYRKDEEASFTEIITDSANIHRINAEDQGIEFYRIQIKVAIDDNTGNNMDYGIEALALDYVVNE